MSSNDTVITDLYLKKYLIIHHDTSLKRVYLAGYRIHHGFLGALCFVLCVVAASYFGSLVVDDWHDRPWLPKKELIRNK